MSSLTPRTVQPRAGAHRIRPSSKRSSIADCNYSKVLTGCMRPRVQKSLSFQINLPCPAVHCCSTGMPRKLGMSRILTKTSCFTSVPCLDPFVFFFFFKGKFGLLYSGFRWCSEQILPNMSILKQVSINIQNLIMLNK